MQALAAAAGYVDQILLWAGLQNADLLNVLKIIGIDLVLSGDNAVVIALACRNLPRGTRLLGITLGAGVAVVLRIIFTTLVQTLLNAPWLKLIGGIVLLLIAIKLLKPEEPEDDDIRAGKTLLDAVKIVAVADVVMSFDNVLAIAGAAGQDYRLVALGLAISIPLVVFGSTILVWLLNRLPILVWVGAALLGWIAGGLILTEPQVLAYFGPTLRSLQIDGDWQVRLAGGIGAAIVVLSGAIVRAASRSRRKA